MSTGVHSHVTGMAIVMAAMMLDETKMLVAPSACDSGREINRAIEKHSALKTAKIIAQETSPMPGRRTINTPMKAAAMADARRGPKLSCRKMAASSVAKTGAMKNNVVAVANGRTLIA